MKKYFYMFLLLLLFLGIAYPTLAESPTYSPKEGPIDIEIEEANAKFYLPEKLCYLDKQDSEKFFKANGNSIPVNGIVAKYNSNWFIYYQFNKIGYSRMNDIENSIKSINILDEIKKNTEKENIEREKAGYPKIEVGELFQNLSLNPQNHSVKFAIETKQNQISRIEQRQLTFGRYGYLLSGFVCTKDEYGQVKVLFNQITKTLSFEQNFRYEDFRPSSDKYATATIGTILLGREIASGGWLSKALKSVMKFIWAVIVALFTAIGIFFKKIFHIQNK